MVIASDAFTKAFYQSDFLDVIDEQNFTPRGVAEYIANNREQFLKYCNEPGLTDVLRENDIDAMQFYTHYVAINDFYNRTDTNFLAFGFSLGYIIFMLYYILYLKKLKVYFIGSIIPLFILFLDTYFDGAVIYYILRLPDIKAPNKNNRQDALS